MHRIPSAVSLKPKMINKYDEEALLQNKILHLPLELLHTLSPPKKSFLEASDRRQMSKVILLYICQAPKHQRLITSDIYVIFSFYFDQSIYWNHFYSVEGLY